MTYIDRVKKYQGFLEVILERSMEEILTDIPMGYKEFYKYANILERQKERVERRNEIIFSSGTRKEKLSRVRRSLLDFKKYCNNYIKFLKEKHEVS